MIRVHVVDMVGGDPVAVDVEPSETVADQTVLYVPVPQWAAPNEIDRLINSLHDRYTLPAETVVIRLHPGQVEAFLDSSAPADLTSRVAPSNVVVLSWSDTYSLQRLDAGEDGVGAGLTVDQWVPILREAECRALIQRSGVTLPSDETYHYDGPNGRHYESFVRVGTAIQAVDALDDLAFWLLPQLVWADVLVLDSWTILSLGLNAERYWRATCAALGLESRDQPLVVECFRRYGESSAELERRLRDVGPRSDGHRRRALVLMSVASTGRTAKALVTSCEAAELVVEDQVNLYAGRDGQVSAFCLLDEAARHWPAKGCPLCDEGSRTVRILPDTYLLELSATVRDDVVIRMPHARPAIEFFDRYGGLGAVSVHRDQEGGERHHMVHIDVERLLETPQFQERLEVELADIENVEVIVCPRHQAGRALAKVVGCHLGVEVVAADPEELLRLGEPERSQLEGRRSVLIVDDIVMTGTRLRRYRNWLHRSHYALTDDFELHFLAGLARPDDLGALRGVVDFTHFAERFHYVELLLLPNWDRAECPWCHERKLLELHGHTVADHGMMKDRFTALGDTATGLREELFLRWLADQGPAADPFLLGPGSIFGARDEPELFACIASCLQTLRNNQELNERLTLPVAKVLQRSFTFSGRFYDTVITACLLRAARRHDLRASITDPGLEAEVRTRLREEAVTSLHGELLLAIERHQLPGATLPEVGHALDDAAAEAGVRKLLAAALDR